MADGGSRFIRERGDFEDSNRGAFLALDVTLEQVVFIAAGAFGALQAADQEESHSHRHQDRQEIRVDSQPVCENSHKSLPKNVNPGTEKLP